MRYYYNAWGLEVAEWTGGRSAEHPLRQYNALKYRGYYYYYDLGMYYLNSRFYDSVICRFVNADGFIVTEYEFLGSNMFSYCINNLVNMVDNDGDVPKWLVELSKTTGSMASAASVAGNYRGQVSVKAAKQKPNFTPKRDKKKVVKIGNLQEKEKRMLDIRMVRSIAVCQKEIEEKGRLI